MPQIFKSSANTIFRVVLLCLVLLAAGGAGWIAIAVRSDYLTRRGVPIEQPIPFSHRHHVGEDGIDCRYCHTTVETSAFAGMPTTQICMNCHTQIWSRADVLRPLRESWATGRPIVWRRVHNLAGFAYFHHGIHVSKGIACVTCHGRVDRMPLMWKQNSLLMTWCTDCHRHPERYIGPKEQVFDMDPPPPANRKATGRSLVESYHVTSRLSCSTCHR